ncbi:MAG: D-alanine--D-alanine ligase [Negativicutes bacterium]|nr:D-alanine--D-alanine ligase [Negativicutes bacterium]
MKSKKVAVVMGGPSDEREVSLNTGRAILSALQAKDYNVIGIDLEPERFATKIIQEHVEVVFNAIHGKYGEDGKMQGALELLGIPYTGSGVLASAIAMDKGISKQIFIAAGVPTPRSCLYTKKELSNTLLIKIESEFGLPVVVKSASQGSSIGVYIVEKTSDLQEAMNQAFKYSESVLVEEYIKGREVTVAVLGNNNPKALPIVEIAPHSGRYDYHSKYTKGATEYIVPAKLDDHVASSLQQVAIDAFIALGCKGIARVDIMIDKQNRPYVLEVNTIPGMTATSLVPKAAAAAGIAFDDLCEQLLLMTQEK